jgi:hypothetical protein
VQEPGPGSLINLMGRQYLQDEPQTVSEGIGSENFYVCLDRSPGQGEHQQPES